MTELTLSYDYGQFLDCDRLVQCALATPEKLLEMATRYGPTVPALKITYPKQLPEKGSTDKPADEREIIPRQYFMQIIKLCTNLTHLEICGDISKVFVEQSDKEFLLKTLANLKTLKLTGTIITAEFAALFCMAKKIRSLALIECMITDEIASNLKDASCYGVESFNRPQDPLKTSVQTLKKFGMEMNFFDADLLYFVTQCGIIERPDVFIGLIIKIIPPETLLNWSNCIYLVLEGLKEDTFSFLLREFGMGQTQRHLKTVFLLRMENVENLDEVLFILLNKVRTLREFEMFCMDFKEPKLSFRIGVPNIVPKFKTLKKIGYTECMEYIEDLNSKVQHSSYESPTVIKIKKGNTGSTASAEHPDLDICLVVEWKN